MKMNSEIFGKLPTGETANLYTLENDNGMVVTISDFGGIITNVFVPDRKGDLADVALAHDEFESYLLNPGSYGALIGRNANRIKDAVLVIDNKTHQLPVTGGGMNAHGGPNGLSRRLHNAELKSINGCPALLLSIVVPDMDDGFPGTLTVETLYTLTNDNAIVIEYKASSDKDTIINLTNHSYFNLAGHDSGHAREQVLWIDSDFYSANLESGLVSGEICAVEGTPLDFRTAKPINNGLLDPAHGKDNDGFNNNYFLNGSGYRLVSTLSDPASGRVMETYTDLPCIQLFTANHLPMACREKGGAEYVQHQGVALETQYCPNSPYQPWLKSPIFRAGEVFSSTTAYKFLVK